MSTLPAGDLLNRELGILEFNARVLAQAADPGVPLMERLKFICIVSSNLDEFFEIRIAGLKEQMRDNPSSVTPDGLSVQQAFGVVSERVATGRATVCHVAGGDPAVAGEGRRLLPHDHQLE